MSVAKLEAAKEACGSGELPRVSFIIPALNEAGYIARTLDAIRDVTAGAIEHEIIVVDNGSMDGTVEIARERGAAVHALPGATIAGLRNHGVRCATGEVIVFLDADVVLMKGWGGHAAAMLSSLRASPRLITGGPCDIPAHPSWIERAWYGRDTGRASRYIASGHLIATRSFLAELGGFDESLETGEDYDLCMRAWQAGGEVVVNPALHVVHEGYPRTVRSFIRREIWHGLGDFANVTSLVRSPVALSAVALAALHLGAVAAILAGAFRAVFAMAAAAVLLCALGARRRYHGRSPLLFLLNMVLCYWYLWARAAAGVFVLLNRRSFRERDRR